MRTRPSDARRARLNQRLRHAFIATAPRLTRSGGWVAG